MATAPPNENERTTIGAVVGLLLGGTVGFMLRPANALVGQLDLSTVLLRGSNLQGFDRLLINLAEASFNVMLAGAVLGVVLGAIAGRFLSPRIAVFAVVAIAVLFLGLRGAAYYQCQIGCGDKAGCAAKAERENPFARLGGRNDIGRALCEKNVDLCLSRCSLF